MQRRWRAVVVVAIWCTTAFPRLFIVSGQRLRVVKRRKKGEFLERFGDVLQLGHEAVRVKSPRFGRGGGAAAADGAEAAVVTGVERRHSSGTGGPEGGAVGSCHSIRVLAVALVGRNRSHLRCGRGGRKGETKEEEKISFKKKMMMKREVGCQLRKRKKKRAGEMTAAASITTTTKHNIYSHILLPLTEQRDRYSLAADLLLILEYTGSPSDSFPVKVDVESFLQTFFFDEKGD